MEVHATACFAKQRLWHERDGLSIFVSGQLRDILDDHRSIARLYKSHHRGFDLTLTWSAHFMMMIFDGHAHLLHVLRHTRADLVKLILRRNGVITAMQRDVVSMSARVTVPIGFTTFNGVA